MCVCTAVELVSNYITRNGYVSVLVSTKMQVFVLYWFWGKKQKNGLTASLAKIFRCKRFFSCSKISPTNSADVPSVTSSDVAVQHPLVAAETDGELLFPFLPATFRASICAEN